MLPSGTPAYSGPLRYEQLDSHIGQGTYGKVEKARDKLNGEVVAIKKVKVEASSSLADDVALNGGRDAGGLPLLCSSAGIHFTVLREIKVMRELNHPNIISIRDVYVEGDFISVVMPHMASDLRRLMDRRVRLSEAQVKCITQQILAGLTYLHSHWYLHRDLAPANVFIDKNGVCKLADFGLSRGYGSPRPSAKTSRVVTLWYRAPELLFGAPFYQDRIDVWSVGCILGELLQGGKPLFPGEHELDQLARIFELLGTPSATNWPDATQLPTYVEFTHCAPKDLSLVFPAADSEALDLLKKLLELDPFKRISAAEVRFGISHSSRPSLTGHKRLWLCLDLDGFGVGRDAEIWVAHYISLFCSRLRRSLRNQKTFGFR